MSHIYHLVIHIDKIVYLVGKLVIVCRLRLYRVTKCDGRTVDKTSECVLRSDARLCYIGALFIR